MSSNGFVAMYTNATNDAAIRAIEAFRQVAHFQRWGEMWRCEPPGQEEKMVTHNGKEHYILPTFGEALIGWEVEYERGLSEIRDTKRTAVLAYPHSRIWELIDPECRAVAESVRGNFMCNAPRFVIGPHDLAEVLGDYRYFGRPTFSLQFAGSNSPADPDRFVEEFVALPVVAKLRRTVEEYVGSLKVCACFEG